MASPESPPPHYPESDAAPSPASDPTAGVASDLSHRPEHEPAPGRSLDGRTLRRLLQKHNPILVLFPQRASHKRPGAPIWNRKRGDYHPCSAEFFLARVGEPRLPPEWDPAEVHRPLLYRLRLRSRQPKPTKPRFGLARVRRKLSHTWPVETAAWQADLADFPSQDKERAWDAYRKMLDESEHPYEPVVYGRYVRGPSGVALQYWYLYIYNDFLNVHEGDWEMVALELGRDGVPTHVGYSSHHGGSRREWLDTTRIGDRPLVYVARGSHAAYFRYAWKGHPARGLEVVTNLGPSITNLINAPIRLFTAAGFVRDHPPADPLLDNAAVSEHVGERVDLDLRIMPRDSMPSPESRWWWMRYMGHWGSAHGRMSGSVGPHSPWGPGAPARKWYDPVGWLRKLPVSPVN